MKRTGDFSNVTLKNEEVFLRGDFFEDFANEIRKVLCHWDWF